MQFYCNSLSSYQRLRTREVSVGNLLIGNLHPIRIQTMTTTDTMDTLATVEQSIRCIEAGAELVRITAPSKKEAENLQLIRDELRRRGYNTPLVADIHFTPNAAEIAARIVEKVRVNPGNYIDKKKFETIAYTDLAYAAEIERIRERFLRYPDPHPHVVIHGHTIHEDVDERDNRIGIDTGAYRSGRLTALALEGTARRYIQAIDEAGTITIQKRETIQ